MKNTNILRPWINDLVIEENDYLWEEKKWMLPIYLQSIS